MKTCNKCRRTLAKTEFYKDKNCADGRMGYCKYCYKELYAASHRQRAIDYYYRNQDESCKKKRERPNKTYKARIANAKHSYGLADAELQELLLAQQGCCKICGRDFGSLSVEYHIDHDHDTGAVRGLLCPACNTAVGLIENHRINPKKIAEYLNVPWEWL